jgi:hypothetical protein
MDAWLIDIAVGPSLPLLYSLYVTGFSWVVTSVLLLASTIVSCFYTLHQSHGTALRIPTFTDHVVHWAVDMLKLLLNTCTLMAKIENSDSPVVVLLCLAPLFTLISIPGSPSDKYTTTVKGVGSITSGLLMVTLVWLMVTQDPLSSSPPIPPEKTQSTPVLFVSFLQIVTGALYALQLDPNTWIQFHTSSRKALLYCIISNSTTLLRTLLRSSDNSSILWFLHLSVLLQSSLLTARSARKNLKLMDIKDPQRITILINAFLLTVSYTAQKSILSWGPWIGPLLLALHYGST